MFICIQIIFHITYKRYFINRTFKRHFFNLNKNCLSYLDI